MLLVIYSEIHEWWEGTEYRGKHHPYHHFNFISSPISNISIIKLFHAHLCLSSSASLSISLVGRVLRLLLLEDELALLLLDLQHHKTLVKLRAFIEIEINDKEFRYA